MLLHLATNKNFNYLAYLAVMTARLHNKVVFWYEFRPENKYYDLIEKVTKVEVRKIDAFTGITIDQNDQTGRLDILYLSEFTPESIDHAFIRHDGLYKPEDELGFERNDISLVRIHIPEGENNLDFITPSYIKNSNNLLSALVKRLLLERVWNPYNE